MFFFYPRCFLDHLSFLCPCTRNGEKVKVYEGPRDKAAIRSFLENPNQPPPPPPPKEKVGKSLCSVKALITELP